MGTVHALEGVVPAMLEQGHGRIVGTASVAGYRGLPGAEAYGATKAALLNLFEALRGSLGPRGIVVQTLSPGFVKTPMTDRNSFPMPFLISPEAAARTIADGIAKDKAEVVFPLPMMLHDEDRPPGAGARMDGGDRRDDPPRDGPAGLSSPLALSLRFLAPRGLVPARTAALASAA